MKTRLFSTELQKPDDLVVFPNPATNVITLKIEDVSNESFTARISDINGKVISQQKIDFAGSQSQLDVSNLNTGNYIIQLINSKKQYAQKIVKI